jgi:hypothetical protein
MQSPIFKFIEINPLAIKPIKLCVISSFCRGVNFIFILLGRYAMYIGSYRRFGTTYRSQFEGSSIHSENLKIIVHIMLHVSSALALTTNPNPAAVMSSPTVTIPT